GRVLVRQLSGSADGTVTFLHPKVNPHGEWAAAAAAGESGGGERWWSLGERRALLMYGRALEVDRKREPDWDVVGQRLGRDAGECRFIYMAMVRRWRHQHSPRADAGVRAG
ncbi:hypothetical protein IWQ56_006033, partial [Coemansia nantahalensis]